MCPQQFPPHFGRVATLVGHAFKGSGLSFPPWLTAGRRPCLPPWLSPGRRFCLPPWLRRLWPLEFIFSFAIEEQFAALFTDINTISWDF